MSRHTSNKIWTDETCINQNAECMVQLSKVEVKFDFFEQKDVVLQRDMPQYSSLILIPNLKFTCNSYIILITAITLPEFASDAQKVSSYRFLSKDKNRVRAFNCYNCTLKVSFSQYPITSE